MWGEEASAAAQSQSLVPLMLVQMGVMGKGGPPAIYQRLVRTTSLQQHRWCYVPKDYLLVSKMLSKYRENSPPAPLKLLHELQNQPIFLSFSP